MNKSQLTNARMEIKLRRAKREHEQKMEMRLYQVLVVGSIILMLVGIIMVGNH